MKGQAEIFGVAIVALMIVALILITTAPEKTNTDHNEIRALASMLSASFDCNGEQKPLIDFVRMCPEKCSCAAVAIDYLLPLEGKRHSFEIVKNGEIIFERNTATCPKDGLLLPSGTLEARLGIC